MSKLDSPLFAFWWESSLSTDGGPIWGWGPRGTHYSPSSTASRERTLQSPRMSTQPTHVASPTAQVAPSAGEATPCGQGPSVNVRLTPGAQGGAGQEPSSCSAWAVVSPKLRKAVFKAKGRMLPGPVLDTLSRVGGGGLSLGIYWAPPRVKPLYPQHFSFCSGCVCARVRMHTHTHSHTRSCTCTWYFWGKS